MLQLVYISDMSILDQRKKEAKGNLLQAASAQNYPGASVAAWLAKVQRATRGVPRGALVAGVTGSFIIPVADVFDPSDAGAQEAPPTGAQGHDPNYDPDPVEPKNQLPSITPGRSTGEKFEDANNGASPSPGTVPESINKPGNDPVTVLTPNQPEFTPSDLIAWENAKREQDARDAAAQQRAEGKSQNQTPAAAGAPAAILPTPTPAAATGVVAVAGVGSGAAGGAPAAVLLSQVFVAGTIAVGAGWATSELMKVAERHGNSQNEASYNEAVATLNSYYQAAAANGGAAITAEGAIVLTDTASSRLQSLAAQSGGKQLNVSAGSTKELKALINDVLAGNLPTTQTLPVQGSSGVGTNGGLEILAAQAGATLAFQRSGTQTAAPKISPPQAQSGSSEETNTPVATQPAPGVAPSGQPSTSNKNGDRDCSRYNPNLSSEGVRTTIPVGDGVNIICEIGGTRYSAADRSSLNHIDDGAMEDRAGTGYKVNSSMLANGLAGHTMFSGKTNNNASSNRSALYNAMNRHLSSNPPPNKGAGSDGFEVQVNVQGNDGASATCNVRVFYTLIPKNRQEKLARLTTAFAPYGCNGGNGGTTTSVQNYSVGSNGRYGPEVKAALRRHGFKEGFDDAGTERSVRALQIKLGLAGDGVVGPLTTEKFGITSSQSGSVLFVDNSGRYGPEVKAALIRHGFKEGFDDAGTERSVRALQIKLGLDGDGVVGPLTRDKFGISSGQSAAATTPSATATPPNGASAQTGASCQLTPTQLKILETYNGGKQLLANQIAQLPTSVTSNPNLQTGKPVALSTLGC
jgi:hypothetical protein